LYFVEKRSKRAIHRLTGAHRDTITRAVASEASPKYERPGTVSKLDPFKEWICELLQRDPTIRSLRPREPAAELGDDFGAAQKAMEETDVNARWQAEMTAFFELPGGGDPTRRASGWRRRSTTTDGLAPSVFSARMSSCRQDGDRRAALSTDSCRAGPIVG
jgi:hypothetical protein